MAYSLAMELAQMQRTAALDRMEGWMTPEQRRDTIRTMKEIAKTAAENAAYLDQMEQGNKTIAHRKATLVGNKLEKSFS